VGFTNKYVIRFCVFDNNILTATENGLFLSTNNGTSWNNVNTGLGGFVGIDNLVVNGSNIFAGTRTNGVYRSTNNGASWTTSSDFTDVTVLTVNGSNLLAGTSSNGLFLSTDNGNNWTSSNSGIPKNNLWNPPFYSIVTACAFKPNGISANDVFVGTVIVMDSPGRTVMFGQRLYRSTDNGTNWILADSGFTNNITTLLIDGTNILAGTGDNLGDDWGYGVLLSTDNGNNWTTINSGLPNNHSSHDTTHYSNINALIKNNSRLFAGTNYGIYMSSNSGINWTKSFDTVVTTSFTTSSNNLFAGTYNGVILSTNNGESWTAINNGLSKSIYNTNRYAVNTLTISGTNLYAGTDNGVWRRPLSEMITDVKQSASPSPETYSLSQNYPNPFNPSTTITFSIPERSTVRLSIFNTLGQKIYEIVNETKDAGSYEQSFNASQLSTGIYFYRIEATSTQNAGKTFVETKKMILIR
jgi:hypothetical protein